MKLRESDLGPLFREATARAERSGCPATEVLARQAAGDLDVPERERLADHLGVCAECAAEVRLLVPFEEVTGRPVSRPAASRVPWPTSAALAAGLLLACGLSFTLWRGTGTQPPADRGGRIVIPGVEPRDGALLADAPERLSFPGAVGALRYLVVVYDAEATPVWESPPLDAPTVLLPADLKARLARGQITYWRFHVVGTLERRPSPLLRFRLGP